MSGMKIGDRVRLIGIPPNLKDDEDLKTRSLFETCLGKSFPIADFKSVEGLSYQLVQLDVGHVWGKPEYMESIWVEPEYLLFESPK
jgi:hypothetical protein